jgi:hypothetical protein
VNIRASASNLTQAAKDLAVDWEQTKAHWRDVKSIQFEKDYLDEIPQQFARAITAMEEIETLLRKVRSDCE